MKTLRSFLITPLHATIPVHLARLDLFPLVISAKPTLTTEDLKLENPGVPGYDAVSLGDVETSGTTHSTTQFHSLKGPIPKKQRGKKLKSQF
jgi:hypothetical protein